MRNETALASAKDPEMPPTILVVDDEPLIRTLLAELLAEEGFPVQVAGDGAEALAVLEQEPPALVVSDLMMPGIDGISLVQELRRRGYAMPVVLISANPPHLDPHLKVRFLAKPFDVEALLSVIRQNLDGQRASS